MIKCNSTLALIALASRYCSTYPVAPREAVWIVQDSAPDSRFAVATMASHALPSNWPTIRTFCRSASVCKYLNANRRKVISRIIVFFLFLKWNSIPLEYNRFFSFFLFSVLFKFILLILMRICYQIILLQIKICSGCIFQLLYFYLSYSQAKVISSTFWIFKNFSVKALDWCLTFYT